MKEEQDEETRSNKTFKWEENDIFMSRGVIFGRCVQMKKLQERYKVE